MDQDYTITEVQSRDSWTGAYGPMSAFALKLQGVDGWVSLNQKPETPTPTVGEVLHGHMDTKTSRDGTKTWLQFKKVRKDDGNYPSTNSASAVVGDGKTLDYIVQMLEELTGRRQKPDTLPNDETAGEEIRLEDIPF